MGPIRPSPQCRMMYNVHAQTVPSRPAIRWAHSLMGTVSKRWKIRSPTVVAEISMSSPLARQLIGAWPGSYPRQMLRRIGSLSAMHRSCPAKAEQSSPDSATRSTVQIVREQPQQPQPASIEMDSTPISHGNSSGPTRLAESHHSSKSVPPASLVLRS